MNLKYSIQEALHIALSVLSAVSERRDPQACEVEVLREAYPEFAEIKAADELACAIINSITPKLRTGLQPIRPHRFKLSFTRNSHQDSAPLNSVAAAGGLLRR